MLDDLGKEKSVKAYFAFKITDLRTEYFLYY